MASITTDVGVCRIGDRDRGQDPRPDSRVDDRFQVAQGCRVSEDDPSERRAVQGAIGQHEVRPEAAHHGVEGRFAGIEHVACHVVRIDHDDARPLQPASPPPWTCRSRWGP